MYKRHDEAIDCLRKAIAVEDSLSYIEPADWYLPVRESLGNLLLIVGRPAEAEKVFREDLERNRRNGRSLFGLVASLSAQQKDARPAGAAGVRGGMEECGRHAEHD